MSTDNKAAYIEGYEAGKDTVNEEAYREGYASGLSDIDHRLKKEWIYRACPAVVYFEGRDIKPEHFEWVYAAVVLSERTMYAPKALTDLVK